MASGREIHVKVLCGIITVRVELSLGARRAELKTRGRRGTQKVI